ncbi:hypothetical protein Lupro_09815 [Lutibacter profundi]|uniref:Transporter n=1 Tax=Lutibacter profundi TaxID=1622118 RepID=A0A120IEF9_9FLAO|nr:hypothetical protein [Lutibacter profundi]AMC11545.1 hypothetical protein Lupro_09815 [Lutibacter profundi]
MQNINYLLFILLFYKHTLNAQTVEPSKGIDKNKFQIELESIYSIDKKENNGLSKSISTPNFLFRYGFLKNIELQIAIPIIKEKYYEENELVYATHKFDDTQLGFSVNLWNQKKWLPEAAFMTRIYLHYLSNLNFNYVGQTFSLNLSNTLTKKLNLNYNIGYAFEKNTQLSSFIITNLTYKLFLKGLIFLEFSGNNTKTHNFLQNITTGLSYNIEESLTLDFSIAKGLNHSLFYTGARATWIINTK